MTRLLIIGVLLLTTPDAYAQTEVSGEIREDTVWEGGSYYVSRDITVLDGAVLTIKPGTTVEFGYDDTIFVRDGGRLVADGATFRPKSTLGTSAAVYVHEVRSSGSVLFTNSTFQHVFVYTSGAGENVFEANRFEGEAHVRLFSRAGVRLRGNSFATKKPIWTEIMLPASDATSNSFEPGSVLFHPHAQRITRNDTVRTIQGLPILVDNNVSVTAGATLVIPAGLEIRHGYFDSFLVNGRALLKANGVHFRPAEGLSNFPAIIVSQGDGPGRAEIVESVVESLYLQFSGGSGQVSRTDFLTQPGRTAVRNTGTESIDARNNFWNGHNGPTHPSNPQGSGAVVTGAVEYDPWLPERAHQVSTGIEDEVLPFAGGVELESLYPNPATNEARLQYRLSRPQFVTFSLFDMRGRLVQRASPGYVTEGRHELHLDLDRLAGGVYVLRMDSEGTSDSRKVVVVR